MRGEYTVKEDKVHMRFVKRNTIFSLKLLIQSTSVGINNILLVLFHKIQEIDSSFISNITDKNTDRAEGLKFFKFKKIPEFGALKSMKDVSHIIL